jgi:type I restriction enzyme S subunit
MSREMKDSGIAWIGEIPKGWKVSRYKYFATSRMGETILSEDTREEGIPIYSATQDDKIFGYVEKSNIILTKGDFVIPARGNSIGCISIVKEDIATCTQTTICSRNIRNINSLFLYYCGWGLKNEWFKYDGSAIPQVTVSQINNNILPLPPLPEQQKIVEFLDRKCGEIDELVALQEKMIEELKAYKQSVITEAVTKGLNPNAPMKDSGIEWIGEIPRHWEMCRVRNVGITQNGISKGGEFFGEGEPFVTYSDVYKNMVLPKTVTGLILSTKEEQDKFSVKKGDVFFTRTSETIEEIGISSICEQTISNAVFAGFLIRLRLFSDKLLICFAKYYFRSNIHRTYFVREMNIVTRASLSQDLLKSLIILLPSLTEQQQIADYLDRKCAEIDELVAVKQQKIETLKEYKKSLIYEYVTGKKEVI